jgi:hypothetical protein
MASDQPLFEQPVVKVVRQRLPEHLIKNDGGSRQGLITCAVRHGNKDHARAAIATY